MFQPKVQTSTFQSAIGILELIYHSIVRNVRKKHGNAIIGLLMSILQTAVLVAVFYIMFSVLGLRALAIRGDFLMYLLSGIFLFMTHNKAVNAVMSAEDSTSAMMQHAPMNTAVSITSSALAALYTQLLALIVVLFIYHVAFKPIEILYPAAAFGMFLLSWVSGVVVGFGCCRGFVVSGAQTLVPRIHCADFTVLPAGKYDNFGENVPCQHVVQLHAFLF